MAAISVYIVFDGNCREAMAFYQRCLGGELTLQTVAESPMANQWPAEAQQKILHAALTNGNLTLFGADVSDDETLVDGNTVVLSLNTNSKKQLQQYFDNLSDGATITRPLHQFFAGTIGAITDRYNKKWIFFSNNTQD
jgi:PhnB protein